MQYNYTGENFFPAFDFFTQPDPTHGFITYVDQAQCESEGIARVSNDGKVYMSVDNRTVSTGPRDSVRITSKAAFDSGLFILDVEHIPTGCATWPAFWLVGPSWPSNGEIDIIEGVNTQTFVSTTLHTNDGCKQTNADSTFTGHRGTGSNGQPCDNCFVNAPGQYNNQGCGIEGASNSYGPGFNENGGGVFATVWTDAGIAVYFFSRGNIPKDIQSAQPNPASWGEPYAQFDFGSDCPSSHFHQNQIVFDTVLCGDWAGSDFARSCASVQTSCEDFVKSSPEKLNEAYWSINSLLVYQTPSVANAVVVK